MGHLLLARLQALSQAVEQAMQQFRRRLSPLVTEWFRRRGAQALRGPFVGEVTVKPAHEVALLFSIGRVLIHDRHRYDGVTSDPEATAN